MSSEKDQQSIPTWDGSARTWRRYTREVCWYVRGTAVDKRRYCATKLVGKLKGPARLLAMSWTTMEFDHTNGVRDLLQRLAASPLVRQTLPNAAAICQQYFGFKRDFNEPMNTFLVREALGYAEFVEALLLLYEDKSGIKQHEKTFDLPEEEPDQQAGWYEWRYEEGEPEPDDGSANLLRQPWLWVQLLPCVVLGQLELQVCDQLGSLALLQLLFLVLAKLLVEQ